MQIASLKIYRSIRTRLRLLVLYNCQSQISLTGNIQERWCALSSRGAPSSERKLLSTLQTTIERGLVAVKASIVLLVVGVDTLSLQAGTDRLFSFHDNESDGHTGEDKSPLQPIHGGHSKQNTVQSRNVGDHELDGNERSKGVPAERVSTEKTGMNGRKVGESSTETDRDSAEGQSIGCLGTDFFKVVVLATDNVGAPHSQRNKGNCSKDNTEEQVSSDDALSGSARRVKHNTIFGRFHSKDESKSDGTDKITVKHLDGSQKGVLHSEDHTEEDRKTLCIVDGSVDKQNLSQVVPDDTSFFDGSNNSGEVIIGQNHFGSFTGDISSFKSHSNTHIGLLQGRSIVNTVTCNRR